MVLVWVGASPFSQRARGGVHVCVCGWVGGGRGRFDVPMPGAPVFGRRAQQYWMEIDSPAEGVLALPRMPGAPPARNCRRAVSRRAAHTPIEAIGRDHAFHARVVESSRVLSSLPLYQDRTVPDTHIHGFKLTWEKN